MKGIFLCPTNSVLRQKKKKKGNELVLQLTVDKSSQLFQRIILDTKTGGFCVSIRHQDFKIRL